MINPKLQRINNAIVQLNRIELSVRDMIKKYLIDSIANTNKYNPKVVDISIIPEETFGLTYAPHLSKLWVNGDDIIFMIDDTEVGFDFISTAELQYIANELQ
jgi:hypothetical protein